MALKCLAILALAICVAESGVVNPQQQTASQQFAYFVPQQAQGYQQAYYYAPVALAPASADVAFVDGQQQQQRKQQVAIRAGEAEAAQAASARLFIEPFLTQINSVNAAVQQLLNKADPILVRANLVRSGDNTGATVGWALFYQKSSTSNVQMFVNIQLVGAAADTFADNADFSSVRIWSNGALGTGTARCNAASLGTQVSTITMTSTARAAGTDAATLSSIIGTGSIAPATATLFGTSSIINKSVRFAATANVAADNAATFCGLINLTL